MSEATAEAFRWEDKTFPTDEKDISDIEASEISDSDFAPFPTKSTNSSTEKTSSFQLASTALKTVSSTPVLNSSDESKHPASFERWCVETCAKFYMHVCVYYHLFLSIMDSIFSFIQTSNAFIRKINAMLPWSAFHFFMSTVGNLLLVVMSLAYIMLAELFTRLGENLQQPVKTVLRSPTINSLPLESKQSPTFSQNSLVIPKTFEQQRSPVVPWPEFKRPQKINSEIHTVRPSHKEPVPMDSARRLTSIVKERSSFVGSLPTVSKCLSYFSRKSRSTPQSFEMQRFSAVQRLEIVHSRANNTKTSLMGTESKSHVPMVHIRRTTKIVEDFFSFGSALFRHRGRKIQQNDGRKGVSEKAAKKHESTSGQNSSSSKQCQSSDPGWKEKHPRASNTEARIHGGRKDVSHQVAPKHNHKKREKTSLSKQCGNTDTRWMKKHSGESNTEVRIYDGRKSVSHQAVPKHNPKMGVYASSTKQHQNTHPRREEKRPQTSNHESRIHDGKKGALKQVTPKHGATPGKNKSSNKQSQNMGRGKKA